MPALAAVIPTLGRRAALDRALAALAGQANLAEVVVAADAVADAGALAERVAAHDLPASRVVQAARPGASAARNAGWRATRSPVVLFLDDDVLAGRGLVATHAEVHGRRPGVGDGVLGTVEWAAELTVTPFMRWVERGVQFDYGTAGDETGWGHLYTANLSLKREALEAVGGFDEEEFPFGYEDLDLGRRLHDAVDLRLHVEREARVEHLHAMTLADWKATVRRIAPAERRFVARYPDVAPWFHQGLSAAAERPRAPRLAPALARVVPRATPLVGEKVWAAAALRFRQELAGPFLEAWEAADALSGTGRA